MRAVAIAALLAALVPAPAAAGSDTSIRCEGGIVSLGDATIDLLGKCGAPVLREPLVDVAWMAARVGYSPLRRSLFVTAERWSYDFGPQRFQMTVTVEGGRVVGFDRGNYGYAREEQAAIPFRRAECDASAIHVGDSKVDLLARCGEPMIVDVRPDAAYGVDVYRGVLAKNAAVVDLEVWTYDFGPQQLVRFVYFREGVVRRIDTGSHGYAR
jgi:hypothetical protein